MRVELDNLRPFGGTSMVGRTFKRLTVVGYAGSRAYSNGRSGHFWSCLCSCGKPATVAAGNLTSGKQVSCGCWKSDITAARNFTHGNSKHPLYAVWATMIQRCENPKDKNYMNYGGRGISICRRWKKFENFWEDMAPSWRHGLWIDRRNNHGNFSPDNCFWETPKVSGRNTRRNVYVTLHGDKKTITEWSRLLGANPGLVSYRILHGWDAQKAITTPAGGSL